MEAFFDSFSFNSSSTKKQLLLCHVGNGSLTHFRTQQFHFDRVWRVSVFWIKWAFMTQDHPLFTVCVCVWGQQSVFPPTKRACADLEKIDNENEAWTSQTHSQYESPELRNTSIRDAERPTLSVTRSHIMSGIIADAPMNNPPLFSNIINITSYIYDP